MKKRKLLIYGAGAIGRGYLPWVFTPDEYEYYYVESNAVLREALNKHREFTTYMTVDGAYQKLRVSIEECYAPGDEGLSVQDADLIATAVGPRNFASLRSVIAGLKVPVLCCENDSTLPEQMRKWSGNDNVVFVIPDVITSNTASADMLKEDPLAIITERGECFIDERMSPHLPGSCNYINHQDLEHQWLAKLYVHNTPHCVAAYLGSLCGCEYLHQAMENEYIATIVEGAMNEMVNMLRARSGLDSEFLNYYRDKELSRFRNRLLFDPIARVAREPFRKLGHKDRLVGGAQLCLAAGIVPNHILEGIMAAFYFDRADDPDAHIGYLRRSMSPSEFLRTVFKLRESEALFILLVEQWSTIVKRLEKLRNG